MACQSGLIVETISTSNDKIEGCADANARVVVDEFQIHTRDAFEIKYRVLRHDEVATVFACTLIPRLGPSPRPGPPTRYRTVLRNDRLCWNLGKSCVSVYMIRDQEIWLRIIFGPRFI